MADHQPVDLRRRTEERKVPLRLARQRIRAPGGALLGSEPRRRSDARLDRPRPRALGDRKGVVEDAEAHTDGGHRRRRLGEPSSAHRARCLDRRGHEPTALGLGSCVEHLGDRRVTSGPGHALGFDPQVEATGRRGPLHIQAGLGHPPGHPARLVDPHGLQVPGADEGRDDLGNRRGALGRAGRPPLLGGTAQRSASLVMTSGFHGALLELSGLRRTTYV